MTTPLPYIRYDLTGVNNQFHIEGGKRACIPMSILTLFHLYRRIANKETTTEPIILSNNEWLVLLEKAIDLYEVWDDRYTELSNLFPTIEEVLQLDECEPFLNIFKISQTERSGLVRKPTNTLQDNPQGTLYNLLLDIKKESKQHQVPICALIIIPISVCVAVICSEDSLYLFDSHGGGGSEKENAYFCELLQFFKAIDLSRYLIDKYKIDSLSDIEPEYLELCSEEEILSNYGYHAKILI